MTSLRILMFTTFYPPYSFGGDAVGVQRMAQALAARGHHLTVVHTEDAYLTLGGQPAPGAEPDDGVERIGLRASNGFVATLLTQQLGKPISHRSRIAEITDRGWDIIWHNNASLVGGPGLLEMGDALKVYEAHEHWLVCPTHVLWRHGRELCDKRECLRCVLHHRRPPQFWRYTGLLERQMKNIDLVIAKSEFSRTKHREFGLQSQMEVLPYFLPDLDLATAPDPVRQERPYFLFVGRLEKIKGLQDVFPAFATDGGADLIIAGDGDYGRELRRLAADNPRIKFLNRMPPDALTAYYRGAVALIVPSVCYETFGIILIESFRLATPVIARALGPFPEIVEAAGAGILFRDQRELSEAIAKMLSDSDFRATTAQNARAGFENIWREDRVLAAFGAAFARAAHNKGDQALAKSLEQGALENEARG